MNTQQEIKELREKINESLNKLNELEANYKREKPVIEVGKWYKVINGGEGAIGLNGRFGLSINTNEPYNASNGADNYTEPVLKTIGGFDWRLGYYYQIELADINELTEALTKYFDKYYEGVEKVDRSSFIGFNYPFTIIPKSGKTYWDIKDGFMYKGIFVMDEIGNIAKPVKEEVKERYNMCKDQNAQIDCRNLDCKFYQKDNCTNVSPAITLNHNGNFACWSKQKVN